MKPKIFIGSSVEGLNVAYAIQQNLTHDAEPTVWDQGIFDLSQTSIESLSRAVNESDFAVFVFSPDDITKMRGAAHNSIRDNVIFEFGLFTGRLGRDRVFFVKPDKGEFHLPTDLIGITPGVYNPNREDGRLQAATGPACNLIREAMKKLPIISSKEINEDSSDSTDEINKDKFDWLFDFINKDYFLAKEKLKKKMESKVGEELLKDEAWLIYMDLKEKESFGFELLINMANDNLEFKSVQLIISRMLSWEYDYDKALEVVERALQNFKDDPELLVLKAEHLSSIDRTGEAISILSNPKYVTNPDIAISLSEIYEKDEIGRSIDVIHSAYSKNPNHSKLMFKYARLCQENDYHKEALYLLNRLCAKDPKNTSYLGYLSNSCLVLDLYDKAMSSLKKANELAKEKEAWLLHNIGNLLNNKGFYSESESWLRRGLEVEPSSEYAHDRLSKAIKSKNEQNDNFLAICKEGKSLIRERSGGFEE